MLKHNVQLQCVCHFDTKYIIAANRTYFFPCFATNDKVQLQLTVQSPK